MEKSWLSYQNSQSQDGWVSRLLRTSVHACYDLTHAGYQPLGTIICKGYQCGFAPNTVRIKDGHLWHCKHRNYRGRTSPDHVDCDVRPHSMKVWVLMSEVKWGQRASLEACLKYSDHAPKGGMLHRKQVCIGK